MNFNYGRHGWLHARSITLAIATLATTVGSISFAAESAPPARRAPALSHYEDLMQSLTEMALHGRDQDPLRFLAGDMADIVGDLSHFQTDRPVQGKQAKVVSRLDELIKQLEQSCKGGGSAANRNPRKPANASTIRQGPGGSGEMIDPRQGEKPWGYLPPKQREQILQSKTQGFPAGYESILEKYYQRLAQEQVTAEGTAKDPTPKEEPKN